MTEPDLDQVVYLSNRPGILAQTLDYVRHFMPWVREAVVLAPRAALEQLRQLTDGRDGIAVVGVNEDALLTAAERRDLPDSHGARNALLRRLLYERGPVDDVFIQSDDDYRPLRPVEPALFRQEGRIISYACYDLALWRRDESSYDRVQHSSYLALDYLGAEHLNFASHMPQAIDRELFGVAFAAAAELDPSGAFCEWSLPLNHGRLVAPERFAPPRTYRTICWPRYPHEWPYWRRPERITFENFHPELYEPGGLFAGLSTMLDTAAPGQQAYAKLIRWYRFDLQAGRLRFPAEVRDPWRFGRSWPSTLGRHGFFRTAAALRRVWEYVSLEERSLLSQLAGRIGPAVATDVRAGAGTGAGAGTDVGMSTDVGTATEVADGPGVGDRGGNHGARRTPPGSPF